MQISSLIAPNNTSGRLYEHQVLLLGRKKNGGAAVRLNDVHCDPAPIALRRPFLPVWHFLAS